MNKIPLRHVLLAMIAAALTFGGSFTCNSDSNSDDNVRDEDRDRDRRN